MNIFSDIISSMISGLNTGGTIFDNSDFDISDLDFSNFTAPTTDPTFTSGLNYARSIAGGQNVPNMIAPGTSYSSAMPRGFTQANINSGAVPNPFDPNPSPIYNPPGGGPGGGAPGGTLPGDGGPGTITPPITPPLPPVNLPPPGLPPVSIGGPVLPPFELPPSEFPKPPIGLPFPIKIGGPVKPPINIGGPVFPPIDIGGPFFPPIDTGGPVDLPPMVGGPVDLPIDTVGPIDFPPINFGGPVELPGMGGPVDFPPISIGGVGGGLDLDNYVVPEVPLNNLLNQNPPQGPVGMTPQETAKVSSQQELLNLISNKDVLSQIPADDGVRNQYQVELDEYINKSPINMETYKEELPVGSAINLGIPAVMETVVPMAVPGLSLAKNISNSLSSNNNFSPAPRSSSPSVSKPSSSGIDYSSIYKFGR